jgi:hypothetical protein
MPQELGWTPQVALDGVACEFGKRMLEEGRGSWPVSDASFSRRAVFHFLLFCHFFVGVLKNEPNTNGMDQNNTESIHHVAATWALHARLKEASPEDINSAWKNKCKYTPRVVKRPAKFSLAVTSSLTNGGWQIRTRRVDDKKCKLVLILTHC